MNWQELRDFQFMTHVDNVPGILQDGILSHNGMEGKPHVSVADPDVQARRATVKVPNGRPLHQYANVYFHARNPMLYRILNTRGVCDLVIVTIRKEVAHMPDAIMTDRNAATDLVQFAPSPDGLAVLDAARVYSRSWPSPDPIEAARNFNAKFAELLVPDVVPVDKLNDLTVPCKHAAKRLADLGVTAGMVQTDYDLFFSRGCNGGS